MYLLHSRLTSPQQEIYSLPKMADMGRPHISSYILKSRWQKESLLKPIISEVCIYQWMALGEEVALLQGPCVLYIQVEESTFD